MVILMVSSIISAVKEGTCSSILLTTCSTFLSPYCKLAILQSEVKAIRMFIQETFNPSNQNRSVPLVTFVVTQNNHNLVIAPDEGGRQRNVPGGTSLRDPSKYPTTNNTKYGTGKRSHQHGFFLDCPRRAKGNLKANVVPMHCERECPKRPRPRVWPVEKARSRPREVNGAPAPQSPAPTPVSKHVRGAIECRSAITYANICIQCPSESSWATSPGTRRKTT